MTTRDCIHRFIDDGFTARSAELDDMANTSPVELNTRFVHGVVKFNSAFKGFGDLDFKQTDGS
jgi:hypothetical protein